jgi:peptide/nickel transport system ATP-binding protein
VTTADTSRSASSASTTGDVLLRVTDLEKHFPITQGFFFQRQIGAVKAVDGVSFDVRERETLGLVGESGCGKSTTGRTVTRLLAPTGGKIEFEGRDLTSLSRGDLRPLRREMQMIFQDPYSSLNPRHTIGKIVGAPYQIQGVKTERGIKAEVQDLLARVGLNPEHYNRYPHEFSGGQRQRIGIARAIALRPKLIVCDEPVSALDVSIQAQVVNLLEDLQNEFGLAYVFIAHDLSVVRHICDRVAVMYLGKIMETADRDELYAVPRHPYTIALLSAVPIPDPDREHGRKRILLQGDLPSPSDPPSGCVFRTRCWKAQDRCTSEVPVLRELSTGHRVACHFPEDPAPGAIIGDPVAAGA